jgi:sterol desaturase/sphingolipid hydroxylase (fatty acid hydroxylase superfamily)
MQNLILYAIPGFVILLLIELVCSTLQKRDSYTTKDTLSSIALGLGNVAIGFVGKVLMLYCYNLAYQYRLFTLSSVWYIWLIAFFADDFTYYWFHRISHSVNYFWASHAVHHSSQKYNLSTAVRQTWTGTLSGAFLFWLWMPLLGFSPLMVMSLQSISLIYQFWIHTELINRFPKPIEYFFNTPSHHRVHHGVNLDYLDKNHAGVLIIWDKLFGTFISESIRPTYGLTKNVNSFNPAIIAFSEWHNIFSSIKKAGWRYTFAYLFNAPGWSHDGSSKTTKQLRQVIPKANIN